MLTPNLEAVLNTGARLVHLVTLRPDGRPQVTVVWSGVEDGEIVFAHLAEHQKVKNVRCDPRVAMTVITGGRSAYGLDEYLVVEGTARVTEGGAADLLQELAQRTPPCTAGAGRRSHRPSADMCPPRAANHTINTDGRQGE